MKKFTLKKDRQTFNRFNHFPEDNFPTGKFRATVLDCNADEVTDGILAIYMDLLLIEERSQKVYIYRDTIVDHKSNPRSHEFFDFLDNGNVVWEEYEYLTGLTFDAEIIHGYYNEQATPILCNRKLLAAPPVIEY